MREKIKIQIDLEFEITVNAVVRNVIKEVSKPYKPNTRIYSNNSKNGERSRIMRASRDAVYKAIKKGEVVRPDTCSSCGNGSHEPIHGHHECYRPENRLNVVWLCKSCHQLLHNKKKNGGASCIREELRYH